ncbi:protein of unknown function [Bartonella clarridgeiae 73]|uniref:Uncharacterized protein n=1 Tax=Bartonella clarridgeiae (strain CCUG 45776 / CIP 104772 / 73) TaxID=696125 RepID=E6YJ78_BARC7|nr:protein of unknown function [Bartonella clarridgeiae 73]
MITKIRIYSAHIVHINKNIILIYALCTTTLLPIMSNNPAFNSHQSSALLAKIAYIFKIQNKCKKEYK